MKKILKYCLLVICMTFVSTLLYQGFVSAGETNEIVITEVAVSTIEELKTAFEDKAIIEGNTIKLTDNVVLSSNPYRLEMEELIIDFNGKTIECKQYGAITIRKKVTFKDSSTTDRQKWGGVIFNNESSDSIYVFDNAELIIENGKFVDGGTATSYKLFVSGKLTINDAIFTTKRSEPAYHYNYMIALRANSECTINAGDFYHTDSIIEISGNKYANKCKLTINGGTFETKNSDLLLIYAFYPYVDSNNNKQVITPKIILNNCNMKAKHTVIGYWGGCYDEEFKDTDTKILTILGGTYTSSEESLGSPFEIRTYSDPYTYFNPKDFLIQNGTFESLAASSGAIRLLGPRKRRI